MFVEKRDIQKEVFGAGMESVERMVSVERKNQCAIPLPLSVMALT